ncbi:hypothetical protein GYMLUDRAFT_254802 [Collybiopsis luxurians FD-317 M1]|nr:hypothetical protein GYMLUDRAFT_254802 [Collybiopsis luxurians FD-317 M1]
MVFIRNMIAPLALTAVSLSQIASALTINTPAQELTAGDSLEVSWQGQEGDPASFTLSLLQLNGVTVDANFGVVQTDQGSTTVTLPADLTTQSYRLVATNANDELASTAAFVISAA